MANLSKLMYENFKWTTDTKNPPNLHTTYLVELVGVKVVAYGRKDIMMLLVSLKKELSSRVDRNNPKLIMICWLRQQWQIVSLFQKTGVSVEQFARNGNGLSLAAACCLQYFTQPNYQSQTIKYFRSAHSLHSVFHNNGSNKTGEKRPQSQNSSVKECKYNICGILLCNTATV